MSVRLPPSPRQHRQCHTSRELSVDGSARDFSRLSLVLAAGRRELATAAINDAKRQRIAERDAAREEARKATELKELLEEYDTMEKLLFRQMQVDQEIQLYESGVYKNEAEYENAKEVAEQLEEAVRIKEGRREQDAAAAAAAAAAEEERKAQEEREWKAQVAAQRQRKQEAEEAAAEARNAARKVAGRKLNHQKALDDPYHWKDYLKSEADIKWWRTKGRALAGRLQEASYMPQALLDAWESRRKADEAARAGDPELRRWHARYEEILTIVTNLDDEDEKVRDAAWFAYVQIMPEEMQAFHERNMHLMAEEQEVEKVARKAARKAASQALAAYKEEVAKVEAEKAAEEAEANDLVNVEKREVKRIRDERQAREEKQAQKDAERDQRRAAKEAERRAAREKENAERPPGKRRAS